MVVEGVMVKTDSENTLSSNNRSYSSMGTREAVMVITEPPVGIEFGIDCITYETGPKFRGLTMIPPGLHFLYYGTGMGARQGYFFEAADSQLIINAWDAKNEQILPFHDLSSESEASLRGALDRGDLNGELGPYPLHQHHLWKSNSCFISKEVMAAAQCEPGTLLFPGDESDVFGKSGAMSTAAAAAPLHFDQPHFRDLARTACFVNMKAVDAQLAESVPRDAQRSARLTRMGLDKSELLERLVTQRYAGADSDLLGELQLAFMLFMLLYSYPALQHWKQLVSALCCSEAYLCAHPAFTAAFMKTLFSQLSFSPVDFFEAELSKENFLRPVISSLFSSLEGSAALAASETLREHQRRLLAFLQKKFGLFDGLEAGGDIQDGLNAMEGDEDAPAFVSQEELCVTRQRLGLLPLADEMDVERTAAPATNCPDESAARWAEIDKRMQAAVDPAVTQQLGLIGGFEECVLSAARDGAHSPLPPSSSQQQQSLTPAQAESAMFGWRYPLVHGSMQPREDMAMAALRVLDEADAASVGGAALRQEALLFVETELSIRR